MKTNVDTLLTHVYEIEGLLLVIQRHQQEVPQLVINRLKESINQLHEKVMLIEDQPSPSSNDVPCPAVTSPVAESTATPAVMEESIAPKTEAAEPATPVKQEAKAMPPIKKEESTAPAPKVEIKKEPRDITAAFSINDRFLFQRELFDGNAQQFNDAISAIQRLNNIDQVQLFVTDVLQLDSSNDIVKEFVRLISLSFK